ncbi:MAG TPA: hypothetical protein VJA94_03575 [Candidatus Angelobacter sp.]
MNCQQFQEVLPHIIENGGSAEEEAHLESCHACSELVRDLRYIAEQAKLLLPMRDPNPRVWNSIQQSLQREGLVREGRISRMGQIAAAPTQKKNWTPLGATLATLAVLALAGLLVNYRPSVPANQGVNVASLAAQNSASASRDAEDRTLVSRVSEQNPEVAKIYEDNLKAVNSYISDAQQAVDDDPQDSAAQQQLMDAYEQKAMLYEMATSRALQ